jgi:hypothetical protein
MLLMRMPTIMTTMVAVPMLTMSDALRVRVSEGQHAYRPSGNCGPVSRAPWGRGVTDTPPECEAESIWTRLRRRKVLQWSVAYVAAAWALLQSPVVSVGYLRLAERRTASRHTCTRVGPPDRFNARVVPRRSGGAADPRPELSIVTLLLLLGGGIVWYYRHA